LCPRRWFGSIAVWRVVIRDSACICVRFEVLTAVLMKISVFWDITPCGAVKVNERFRGTYHLHLKGPRVSRALFATCFTLVLYLAYSSTLQMGAIFVSESSAGFRRIIWHYSPPPQKKYNSSEPIMLHTTIPNTLSGVFLEKHSNGHVETSFEALIIYINSICRAVILYKV
jgi:hypothetical protein